MSKKSDNEILKIKELMKDGKNFEYEVDFYNDDFFNDSFQFLEDNNLKMVCSFKAGMYRNFVVKKEQEMDFIMKDSMDDMFKGFDEVSMSLEADKKSKKHETAKIFKFKR